MIIGISGGIAAYKICDLIGLLRKDGCKVKIIMTKNAKEFIQPLTFATLTNDIVYSEMFDAGSYCDVEHIALAKWCDAMLIAPATANIIGKIAGGIADDLLTTVTMALPEATPVFIAPAMNVNMWRNPILEKNMKYLISLKRKYRMIQPRKGRLACGDYDDGCMARADDILKALKSL